LTYQRAFRIIDRIGLPTRSRPRKENKLMTDDKDKLSPDEVRQVLMGEGGEPDSLADMSSSKDGSFRNLGVRTPKEAANMIAWEDVDGVRFLDMPHSNMVYAGYPRCPTCGRTNDCCCPNCDICVNGTPRTITKEKEETT
jgi:hypothetical protein